MLQLYLPSHRLQNSYLDGVAPPETPSRGGSRSAAQFKLPNIRPPKTPVSRHIRQHAPSSRASTPGSSPARIVNQVSSPGPMRPAPEEDQDDLPYTLPPGPYSRAKPEFSYAALIGQAILSSPDHRLTLQDIYEWLTTVYPFYSRNEQTWMNSIRHSLSTMAVFRKVTRGRNEGKSLWAIWDCDLPCFTNGGFRKTLCADMVKNKTHPPLKSGPKRKMVEDTLVRDVKKRKRSAAKEDAIASTSSTASAMFTAPVLPPFYAPAYPNAQQQPYYQAYVPQAVPADVIFPPLPPTSSYHRALSLSTAASRPTTADSTKTAPSVPSSSAISEFTASKEATPEPPAPSSSQEKSSSSSSSVPDLIGSSYSSPPLSSDASLAADAAPEDGSNADIVDPEDEVDRLTAQWLASPSVLDSLEPLHSTANQKMTTPGSAKSTKAAVRNYLARVSLSSCVQNSYKLTYSSFQTGALPVPDSPTMNRRSAAKGKGRMRSLSFELPPMRMMRAPSRPTTPPRRPCTPPRKRVISGSALRLSAQDTPISHRGLHMSPSPSLAHYKSNLDPPPAAVFHPHAPLLTALTTSDDASLTLPSPTVFRTPSRKRTSQPGGSGSRPHAEFSPFAPLTPRRLAFVQDSPFRLAHFIDPHDPSVLLDDELRRLDDKAQLEESPIGGFFGKRTLLYDSPGLTSPSRYW